jgi:hypothetical protein
MAVMKSIIQNHALFKGKFWTSCPAYRQTPFNRGRKIGNKAHFNNIMITLMGTYYFGRARISTVVIKELLQRKAKGMKFIFYTGKLITPRLFILGKYIYWNFNNIQVNPASSYFK